MLLSTLYRSIFKATKQPASNSDNWKQPPPRHRALVHSDRTGRLSLALTGHLILCFCVFSIELEMHSKMSAAYAGRHYAQHGSGTCTGCPGSFRGPAAVCWPHSAKWGQFALGVSLSLGMQRLAHGEVRIWGYRLYISGMTKDRAGDCLLTNMCFVFVKQGDSHTFELINL